MEIRNVNPRVDEYGDEISEECYEEDHEECKLDECSCPCHKSKVGREIR